MVPSNDPVVVTGASGFIGSAVVRELLAHGYRVRGTVRSPNQVHSDGHLTSLPGAERLDLVAADLIKPGAFDQVMEGAATVIHTASPYVVSVEHAQRDLINPALNGTRSVLNAALDSGTVRRVVLTSSFAAVTDEPEGTYDEHDWNESSSLLRNPYYYSKVVAERAAWEFAAEHEEVKVISINPTLVVGPSIVPSLNESNKVLADFTKGVYPGILSLRYGFVDVRDVATAHRLALETDTARGRYLCTAGVWSMREVVELAKSLDPSLPRLPSLSLDNQLGNLLVKAASTFQDPGARWYLRTNIGRKYEIDTSKIRSELGMSFRPIAGAIADAYQDLRKWGHVG